MEAEEAKGDDAGPKEGAPEGSAADASGAEAGEAPEAAMLDMAGVPEGFHAVKVETGLVNDSFVEIISGLSEGDEVYVDSASRTSSDSFTMPQGGMGPGMGGGPEGGPGGNMGGGRP